MAKKKTKVTVKRVKKSKPLGFYEKIAAISSEVERVPSTGVSEDKTFGYTQAKIIFPIFSGLFRKYRLQAFYDYEEPISAVLGIMGGFKVRCDFSLLDLDNPKATPVVMGKFWGSAFGDPWAIEKAQTVAKKSALLYAFDAGWDGDLPCAEDKSDKIYLNQRDRDKLRAEAEDAAGEAFSRTVLEVVKAASPAPPLVECHYPMPVNSKLLEDYIKTRKSKGDKRHHNAMINQVASFFNVRRIEDWPNDPFEFDRALETLTIGIK